MSLGVTKILFLLFCKKKYFVVSAALILSVESVRFVLLKFILAITKIDFTVIVMCLVLFDVGFPLIVLPSLLLLVPSYFCKM